MTDDAGWPTLPADTALVSLDVFDTLLFRKLEDPVQLFDIVAARSIAAGVMDASLAGMAFRRLRQAAEQEARAAQQERSGGREVTLAQIYACLEAALPDPAAVARIELAVEAETSLSNPVLRDWLHHLHRRGLPVVLLSDMYHSTPTIAALLTAAGIGPELYRRLYVSADHGCSKRDGGLFARLLADWPEISPGRIAHIGDDPMADVGAARKAGLTALLYQPSFRYAAARERERRLMPGGAYDPTRRLAALPAVTDDLAFWRDYGALILGPAVAGYCRWVVEDCRRRGIDTILCFWREGAVFAPLMRDYANRRGWPLQVETLAISRQALAPLALERLDRARARALLHSRPHLPWNHLLAEAMGSDPASLDLGDLADLAGLTLDGLLSVPDGALDRVLACFDTPAVQARAKETAASLRQRLVRYVAPMLEDRHVALVDLGARGTTAAALVAALAAAGRPVDGLRAYLCYAVSDIARHQLQGLAVSVYAGDSAMGAALGTMLYRSPQMHERVLTGLDGTTLSYRTGTDGLVEPVYDSVTATGEEARAIAAARQGIARYWQLGLDMPLPMADDALLPLYAAITLPTPEEAQHLGQLRYDQNDGSGDERMICDERALDTVRPLLERQAQPLLPLALGLRPALVGWPQGAMTILDPRALSRHHDAVAVDSGHGAICRAFVESLRASGLAEVILLAVGGEGGMGPAFIQAAAQQGLAVVGYVDLMPELVAGRYFHDVPMLDLADLPGSGCLHVALATLGYRDQALTRIAEVFQDSGLQPVCLPLPG